MSTFDKMLYLVLQLLRFYIIISLNFLRFLLGLKLKKKLNIETFYKFWLFLFPTNLHSALDLDSLDNSHPIEIPVGHPEEVDEIFDIISYQKGSSIIRMLFHWIGPKVSFFKLIKSFDPVRELTSFRLCMYQYVDWLN